MQETFDVVDYTPTYGHDLVRMWRESFERPVGIVDWHSLEDQRRYLEESVVPNNRVLVVVSEATADVIGFMATTPEVISQLYVHVGHQHEGIGSMLVNMAKQQSKGRLRLFTFKVNKLAQRFYERHGFRVIGEGFEKDWQLEDLEYEWSAGTATQARTAAM
ncbi:MAG TPA: GNAT family N-acetyltransferase [Thermoanaerobaculia bacterium]|jgi:ribosomal protein S18 acetylase RimI-like enzyme